MKKFLLLSLFVASAALAQARPPSSGSGSSSTSATGYISTYTGGSVFGGTGDYVLNHVSNSNPALANYGGSCEIGGKTTDTGAFADVYLGSMQNRTSGYIAQFMNCYGLTGHGCNELAVFSIGWDGALTANSDLLVGANQNSGRVSSSTGSLLLIGTSNTVVVWNKGAQNVAEFYTGAGGSLVASVSAAGKYSTGSFYESTGAASSTAISTNSGQLACWNTNAVCTTRTADVSGVHTITGASGIALDALTGTTVVTGDTTSPVKPAFRITPMDAQPSGANVVGDMYVTTAGLLKICTVAGTPGTWVSVGAQ